MQTKVLVRLRSMSVCHVSSGHVLGRDVHAPPAHVVDQDVDRAVLGERRPARALGLGRLPDVGLDRGHLAAARAHLLGGLVEGRLLAPDQDQVRAGLREPERHLAPEPPAPAGDEGPLAVQPEPIEDSHPHTSRRPRRRPSWRARLPEGTAARARLVYLGVTPMFVTRIVWSGRGRKFCTQPCTP